MVAGLQPSARLISRAEKSGRITTERPIDFHTEKNVLGNFFARIRIDNCGLGCTLGHLIPERNHRFEVMLGEVETRDPRKKPANLRHVAGIRRSAESP